MTESYHVIQPPLFPSKECTLCHITKPLDEFYKQSSSRGGYQNWCIVCWNERRRQKRHANVQNPPIREYITSIICRQCHIEKPVDAFYADSLSERGYKGTCKDCRDRADKRRKNPGKRRNKPFVQTGYKWCYGCKREVEITLFSPDKSKWDGYKTKCNDCRAAHHKRYWQENRERLLPERRTRMNHHYASNPDYRRKLAERQKQPRYRLLATGVLSRRRARLQLAVTSEVDFRRIIERDGYHCYVCDQAIDPTLRDGPARLTFDHVIPIARSGTHTEENIKPSHRACNQRKNARLLSEMDAFQRRGPT